MSAATRVWLTANALGEVRPTYHDWRHAEDEDGKYRTHCGLIVWDRAYGREQGLYMRTDHAEKIGRACPRCFLAVKP